jgi:hypothetical protein
MSRATFDAPMISPAAFLMGETVSEIEIGVWFLRSRTVRKWCMASPRRIAASVCASSLSRSLGVMMVIERPMTSSAVYPNILVAAAFQDVIAPSGVLLTIASSED